MTLPERFDPNDDLVDDRAILDSGADRFGHSEFAIQAAQTVRSIKTPANIAIYAPWGSGKSSLSNLMRKELESDTCGFVYFDAFKYAEAPLRREFIRRVASDLGVKHEKFDRGLYVEETRNRFNLNKQSIRSLLEFVGGIAGAAVVFTGLLGLLLAWASGDGFWASWTKNVNHLLPAIFAPAVIIAPLIALIGGQLSIGNKRYAPQSDEEFERLFRDLVARAMKAHEGWDRLVVFIDELDRCGADEVASTLETLRTFLEVEKCVFIVAADRSVLETAVAKRSRQETPYNLQNPYYSAGSSYLDKIFQYQWQLLPMRPSSLTRFAQNLVKDRKRGLWSEVDVGEVTSVLVPLHVQSPRRVKELLNAYAMAYRLAERRIADGYLDTDLRQRAAELAKLVCLQLEFPFFANDLPNEPRLPELVLGIIAGDTEKRSDFAEDVWQRAIGYALGSAELDVMLAGSDADEDEADVEGSEPQVSGTGSESPRQRMVAVQGKFLIRYLQKTQRIPGPAADLVFMEGTGFAFGLATALAELIRVAATESRVEDVVAAIVPLDEEQQIAALRLLAMCVREAQLGLEGDNVLSTLLGAVGALPHLDLASVVNELADAANVGIRSDTLPPDDIMGAICLGLGTNRPVGAELVTRSLANEAIVTDAELAAFVATKGDDFSDQQVPRIGEVVAALLVDLNWVNASECVISWSDARGVKILQGSQTPLLARIKAAKDRQAELDTAGAPAAPGVPGVPGAPADPATPAVEPKDIVKDTVLQRLQVIVEAAREVNRKTLFESVLQLMLSLNTQDARSTVGDALPPLGLVESPTLTTALMDACGRRAISEKQKWLDALDPEVFGTLSDAKRRLEDVVISTWPADDADINQSEYDSFTKSAARLVTTVEWQPATRFVPKVLTSANVLSHDQVGIARWIARLRLCRLYEASTLLVPSEWRTAYLESAILIVANVPSDDLARTAALDGILNDAVVLAEGATSDVIQRLFDTLQTSPWLLPAERCLARVKLTGAVRPEEGESQPVVAPAEILGTYEEVVDTEAVALVDESVEVWLKRLSPLASDVWSVVRRFAESVMPDVIKSGLVAYSSGLGAIGRTELARLALAETPGVALSDVLLESIGFDASDLNGTTDLVIEAFGRATNDDHRRTIFRMWAALKLTDKELISKLVHAIMMPLIDLNKSGRDLVIQNLHLVPGLARNHKQELAERFQAKADSGDWPEIEKKLAKAGLMKEQRSGLFGRKAEHLDK